MEIVFLILLGLLSFPLWIKRDAMASHKRIENKVKISRGHLKTANLISHDISILIAKTA